MKTNPFFDPKQKTSLDKTLGKHALVRNRLVNLAYQKVAKLVTETKSKICKLKTYNKAINNSIYSNK